MQSEWIKRVAVGMSVLVAAGSGMGEGVAFAEERRPPLRGTIFEFPALMKASDPSSLVEIEFVQRTERRMFDRRLDGFETFPVFLFEATFRDRPPMEVAVNREFETQAAAQREAEFYARALGRLPLLLRREVNALHIQAGKQLFGGGRNVLIHTEQGKTYDRDGILEETLGHEAGHALDRKHARHPEWRAAQQRDDHFISGYAKEHPFREDIAESVIPYLAVRFRPERFKPALLRKVEQTIAARMQYFDALQPRGFPPEEKTPEESTATPAAQESASPSQIKDDAE